MSNIFTLIIKNYKGESYELTHNYERYYVKSITGLTPPSAVINTSVSGSYDGSFYNSSRLEQRNIVITLGLKGKVEENRQRLYSIFPMKKECEVYFKNRYRDVKIKGYVESIEGDIFVQREEIQISIICPNPYFETPISVECEMSRTVPLFEFPFSIAKANPISFGKILDKPTCNIYNNGDVDCGCIITINVFDSLTGNPRITNEVTHEFMQFNNTLLMSKDVITINTNYGKMRATMRRVGLDVNLLPYLSNDSTWIKLATGLNTLSFTDVQKNYDNTNIKIEYTPLFGGV